jgi:hypothetical protein
LKTGDFPLLSNGKFQKPDSFPPFSPLSKLVLPSCKSGNSSANRGRPTVKQDIFFTYHHFPLLSNGRFSRNRGKVVAVWGQRAPNGGGLGDRTAGFPTCRIADFPIGRPFTNI